MYPWSAALSTLASINGDQYCCRISKLCKVSVTACRCSCQNHTNLLLHHRFLCCPEDSFLKACHLQVGNYEQAVQDYTQALQVEPTNSYAYYNRGITRDRHGDYQGAVADFSQAISLDPANADFFHNRGFSLRKQVTVYVVGPEAASTAEWDLQRITHDYQQPGAFKMFVKREGQ